MDKYYKWVKKPVIIEAIQITVLSETEVYRWSDGAVYASPVLEPSENNTTGVYWQIKTLEGVMTAITNDWIIKGVKGEFYPCKPDIFEMTYERPKEVELLNWQDILKVMLDTHAEYLPINPITHEESEWYMYMAKRIERLSPALNVEEWISVKDKMPTKMGEYIVYGKVRTDYYVWVTPFQNNNFLLTKRRRVTHWQPLPAAPKNKDK